MSFHIGQGHFLWQDISTGIKILSLWSCLRGKLAIIGGIVFHKHILFWFYLIFEFSKIDLDLHYYCLSGKTYIYFGYIYAFFCLFTNFELPRGVAPILSVPKMAPRPLAPRLCTPPMTIPGYGFSKGIISEHPVHAYWLTECYMIDWILQDSSLHL